jgi:hypothetical protein
MGSLREAFGCPNVSADELDQLVRDVGWILLHYDGLGCVWNPRYAAADGR